MDRGFIVFENLNDPATLTMSGAEATGDIGRDMQEVAIRVVVAERDFE